MTQFNKGETALGIFGIKKGRFLPELSVLRISVTALAVDTVPEKLLQSGRNLV